MRSSPACLSFRKRHDSILKPRLREFSVIVSHTFCQSKGQKCLKIPLLRRITQLCLFCCPHRRSCGCPCSMV
ncbi:hypothetical protein BACCAP_00763 [Pseudoflavonifractor capillosus ATCC 29799]|uniref:Uncharacterized protein n=1 Tax=Pseudoflavonifractor capillosus ATCC 29799 TaxID=411467 RepID=A6NRD5_9FIRM|nr:hypothetical protein BACCAP_00763 [Pseudoflavonifractor capillosus ATCC 29799]